MVLALSGLALGVLCVVQARDRARLSDRVRALEEQLIAYQALADEMARWQAEWTVEKRAMIRAQREAQNAARQAAQAGDAASQTGGAQLVPEEAGEQPR